ncbi:DUF2076 domain-containing protein [Chelatococcus daeguensis]|uniref:Uncharacterized protein conserved in bacteria (DUF2076) n=1 Tax=Chelatococcus sambhunathii TaxID=363953 RepID=A0ABM9U2U7_9HYPH|nr:MULTISPECIES: DUF2076 domain-containing protein [Chelatococcus]KZE29198.1 hypothetical protein AVW15_05190 [Chelatococcus daeguensis]MBM3083914.1 DUF2076 domain-containing protein [Chelatococcus daeguensis]CUA87024.1 Uncharacterized protein conserved in bacteria (DUF2076) [Chelatococcus sambhunathii]
MDNQDRQAIEGLFARLGEVERQAGPRDQAAESFIRERMAQQPGAPYFMAQTIVMQDYALREAQRRIEELERQASRPAGGLLSGLFGGGQTSRAGSVPPMPRSAAAPGGVAPAAVPPAGMQPGRGGGFLAGAAQTAMGVAGGVLLGNAIAGMFGGNEAQAAEATTPEAEPEPAADEGGGFFDGFFGGDEEI